MQGTPGPQGPQGEQGSPGADPRAIARLSNDIERLRADADIQFRRIAQLQAQLDAALAELNRLKS